MKVRPINGHVLVRPLEADEQTAGGVYLPQTAREETMRTGEVVAVAEDGTDEVAVGDRVIFKGLSASEAEVDGEELVLLGSEDVLCKYVDLDEIPA